MSSYSTNPGAGGLHSAAATSSNLSGSSFYSELNAGQPLPNAVDYGSGSPFIQPSGDYSRYLSNPLNSLRHLSLGDTALGSVSNAPSSFTSCSTAVNSGGNGLEDTLAWPSAAVYQQQIAAFSSYTGYPSSQFAGAYGPCPSQTGGPFGPQNQFPYPANMYTFPHWMARPTGYGGGPGNPKKGRQTYHRSQIAILESQYRSNRYVSKQMRAELANLVHLTDRQIKIWFQNRRMKEKKEQKRQEEERGLAAGTSSPAPSSSSFSVPQQVELQTNNSFRSALAKQPASSHFAETKSSDSYPSCVPLPSSYPPPGLMKS